MGRNKEEWLQMTGGFRVGESREHFIARTAEIEKHYKKIRAGKGTLADVNEIARLNGAPEDDLD